MKRFLLLIILITTTFTSFSQSLGYKSLGILFSKENNQGTARFNALSGAFGALGGDISVINVNPAGLAVFNKSNFTITTSIRSTDITSSFYNNSVGNQDDYFSVPQAGGVFIFDTNSESNWNRVAIGLNYVKSNDFRNNFVIKGNNGLATFSNFPLDTKTPKTDYNRAEQQILENTYNGEISEFSVALSGVYNKKLFLGIGINSASLDFNQQVYFSERNNDGDGNILNARVFLNNSTEGNGFSLNLGALYKVNQILRLGLSYQTPTWYYEIKKETNYSDEFEDEGDENITVSNNDQRYTTKSNLDVLTYSLKTPSKLNVSGALVLGKKGLLSAGYTYKNFSKIKLSEANFSDINSFFANGLRNTHSFRVGGEYRLDALSLRAGYSYEKDPNLTIGQNTNKDNLKGFSLGAGYKFEGFNLDIAYSDREQLSFYDIYHQKKFSKYNINPAELKINNRIFSATLSFSL